MSLFQNATFYISAHHLSDLPDPVGIEVVKKFGGCASPVPLLKFQHELIQRGFEIASMFEKGDSKGLEGMAQKELAEALAVEAERWSRRSTRINVVVLSAPYAHSDKIKWNKWLTDLFKPEPEESETAEDGAWISYIDTTQLLARMEKDVEELAVSTDDSGERPFEYWVEELNGIALVHDAWLYPWVDGMSSGEIELSDSNLDDVSKHFTALQSLFIVLSKQIEVDECKFVNVEEGSNCTWGPPLCRSLHEWIAELQISKMLSKIDPTAEKTRQDFVRNKVCDKFEGVFGFSNLIFVMQAVVNAFGWHEEVVSLTLDISRNEGNRRKR
jgi:hypothetical protein